MAITYNAPSNIITLDGANTYNFTDIFNADVAGGWGVVFLQGTTQFLLDCALIIGDGTNATVLSDVLKHVTFSATSVSAHGQNLMLVKNHATVTFGVVIDASTRRTKDGCDILFNNANNYISIRSIRGEAGSTVYLYSTAFRVVRTWEGSYSTLISAITTFRAWNCLFEATTLHTIADADLYRITQYKSVYGLALITTSYANDLVLSDNNINLQLYGTYATTLKNITCKNPTTQQIMAWIISTDNYLINPNLDVWTFNWNGVSTAKVYRQYEFDLTVTDQTGVALSGATVTLNDKDGNVVFTDTTDAFGQIATKTVSRGYYDQAHGDTLQDYSPHTIIVSKTGYITISTIFTFDKYLDWRIPLLAQLTGDADPTDVLVGKTFYNDDVDTKLTGTLALTGNANVSDVLSGRTFYKDDPHTQLIGTLIPPSSGGNVRTIMKPTELEDLALTATTALLIQNHQLKHKDVKM